MANQKSIALRNAELDQTEVIAGTAARFMLFTGAQPANCAAADSGTKLVDLAGASDYMSNAAAGAKALNAAITGAAQTFAGPLTAGHDRIKDSAGTTCHRQGTVGIAVPLTTSVLTAANGNVLNFASTTGVVVGQTISGTGIVAGATVIALTGTTVTMSHTSTAGVAITTVITFGYDMNLDNTSIASGQTVTFNSYNLTADGA